MSKCPNCESSTLLEGLITTTAVFCPPFIDEDGKRHLHDTNKAVINLVCMKCGKVFTEPQAAAPCWCGWPGEDHA